MQLEGVFADSPATGGLPPQPKELDKDAFLQLLVTQLQHQDPIEPAKNEEFIAQLANFSSLEQMELLNENIVTLTLLQQSNEVLSQLTTSSALIGQEVSYLDPETGSEHVGIVDSVKIQDGLATLNVGGLDVPLLSVTEVLGSPGEAGEIV
jgi:flagellar basal-body rod modification protein FlgD